MMMIRKWLTLAVVISATAVSGIAAVSPSTAEWAKGPAQYLLTKEETTRWQAIDTDADAERFISLFWARRDPTPGTTANEYRDEFEARVKYADEKFAAGRKKGSMTERGKVWILFGPPTRVQRLAEPEQIGSPENVASDATSRVNWIYEGERATSLGVPRAQIQFIDQYGNGEFNLVRGGFDLRKAQDAAIHQSIKQPDLTEPPAFVQSRPAVQPPAPAATPAPAAVVAAPVMTEFKTPELGTAVKAFRTAKTNPYKGNEVFLTWDELVTPKGEYFVPVSLYVPGSTSITPAANLTFFGIVEDQAGKPVAVFEEPVKLADTKGDLYFDKSLSLPAGEFNATFGLAENGKPLTMVSTPSPMKLSGTLDKDAPGVSKLILANNVFPLTVAQMPTDPFAFGGIKIIPKANNTFKTTDELWYFVEIRNPGLGDAGAPKIQQTVNIEGTTADGKKVMMTAPPEPATVIELKGVPGHFGVGSSYPLESFKPGSYTFKLKLMDTVRKQSYNLDRPFRVVAQ